MTQDEIIRSPLGREQLVALAREAGLLDYTKIMVVEIERFAALVAANEREKCFEAAMKAAEKAVDTAMLLEREACAKVCEEGEFMTFGCAAAAIRARGDK